MRNQVLKIGEVVEVRGQKVRAEIFSEKNTSTLLFDGELIRNVSVGSYVKISKGYKSIVGRIEGEYISESNILKDLYTRKRDKIVRVIEISIVGTIDRCFKHGITEMPLVGNEVYILEENEVQSIFKFSKGISGEIIIGEILGYSDYKLKLDINKIFASHIGIFGNTGSGKSNTLARLYTNLFEHYKSNESFRDKSRFILFDFNGEFENTISESKRYYSLSTRIDADSKYPVSDKFMLDEEFWSIITEATAKTQAPFINRSINSMKRVYDGDELNKTKICIQIKELLKKMFENPMRYQQLKRPIIDLIFQGFSITGVNITELLGKIGYHGNQKTLYVPGNEPNYFNSQDQYNTYINPVLNLLVEGNFKYNSDSKLLVFKYVVLYQYVKEVFDGISNEEHIAPLIKRFTQRFAEVEKVFVVTTEPIEISNLEIISLVDVNIKMRKIIPLLISKQAYEYQKKSFVSNSSLHIIIDEAHNILSFSSERESSIWKDYRLEVFEEIIKEGRKFGVFMTISSQRPSDISQTLVSQMHNYFLHRLVNNEDIRSIGKSIAFLDSASFEMIPILPQGACIITGTAMNFPIVAQIDLLADEKQPESKTVTLTKVWENEE